MSKEKKYTIQGIVIKKLPDCQFVVELEEIGYIPARIIAYLCGKMRKNQIFVEVDDVVIVELSPYNLSGGRITRRV